MGVQLAKWALSAEVGGLGLSPTARLVLASMALTAQDRDTDQTPARLWWGGHDLLMLHLAGDVPEDERERAALSRRIRRGVSELISAGVLAVAEPAGRGRRAVYRLEPEG